MTYYTRNPFLIFYYALASIFMHKRAFFGVLGIPLMVVLVAHFIPFVPVPFEVQALLVNFLYTFSKVSVGIAWLQIILGKKKYHGAVQKPMLDKSFLSYFLVYILLTFAFGILISIAVPFIYKILNPNAIELIQVQEFFNKAIQIVSSEGPVNTQELYAVLAQVRYFAFSLFIVSFLSFLLITKLSFLFVQAAQGSPLRIDKAWKQSQGIVFALFATFLLLESLQILISLPLFFYLPLRIFVTFKQILNILFEMIKVYSIASFYFLSTRKL